MEVEYFGAKIRSSAGKLNYETAAREDIAVAMVSRAAAGRISATHPLQPDRRPGSLCAAESGPSRAAADPRPAGSGSPGIGSASDPTHRHVRLSNFLDLYLASLVTGDVALAGP
jgi:hypothetical protein